MARRKARSAVTGRYITKAKAKANPRETVVEKRGPRLTKWEKAYILALIGGEYMGALGEVPPPKVKRLIRKLEG
jgi:hypothetical protein